MDKTYFSFVDESFQSIDGEEHVILWILTIPASRLAEFDNRLRPVLDELFSKARSIRERRWMEAMEKREVENLRKSYLRPEKREFKFAKISYDYKHIYRKLVREIAACPYVACTVYVRKKSEFTDYFNQVSLVLSNVFWRSWRKEKDVVIVCDELTLSKYYRDHFATELATAMNGHRVRHLKQGGTKCDYRIKSVVQWNSHWFLWLQAVDFLAGITGYSLKRWYEGFAIGNAKDEVLAEFRKLVPYDHRKWWFAKEPFYYSVWVHKKSGD